MLKIDFSDFYSIDMKAAEERVLTLHDRMEKLKRDPEQFLGWIDYVRDYRQEIEKARVLGEAFRKYEALVVVGIGGSFLGAKSFYDILASRTETKGCRLIFLGTNLCGHDLKTTLKELEGLDFAVNIISKSGGTLEPAIAFRLVKELLYRKYKDGAKERLVVTTDPVGGNLRKLALREGYETLSIPGNVGGRYSVFTPVGVFPLAAAGLDVEAMIRGVERAKADFDRRDIGNLAYQYAVARRTAGSQGKSVEIYTAYDPSFGYYMEWLKQLYGESEGKDGKGIYPLSVVNTRDLHSMGQFIQEGTKNHFETVLWGEEKSGVRYNKLNVDFDGLNDLAGVDIDQINKMAMEGTRKAHKNGGIANMLLTLGEVSPESLAYLSYFFMKACGMTCYLLDVEPFDQPGVEEYKREIKKLLNTLK